MASVIWRQHVKSGYSHSLRFCNWKEVWPMIVTRWNVVQPMVSGEPPPSGKSWRCFSTAGRLISSCHAMWEFT
jgi:hypothetical protein